MLPIRSPVGRGIEQVHGTRYIPVHPYNPGYMVPTYVSSVQVHMEAEDIDYYYLPYCLSRLLSRFSMESDRIFSMRGIQVNRSDVIGH